MSGGGWGHVLPPISDGGAWGHNANLFKHILKNYWRFAPQIYIIPT